MLAALASLRLLILHVREGRPFHLWLSLFLLCLAALSKVEVLFPAAAAHAIFMAARIQAGQGRGLVRAYALTVAAAAGVYALFLARAGAPLWGDNLAAVVNPASDYFIRMQMGLTEPRLNLARMGVALAALAASAAALLATGRVAEHVPMDFFEGYSDGRMRALWEQRPRTWSSGSTPRWTTSGAPVTAGPTGGNPAPSSGPITSPSSGL